MAIVRTRKRSRPRQGLHKPNGHFHTHVQPVGREHFGRVCIDPHKARFTFPGDGGRCQGAFREAAYNDIAS